MTWTALRAEVVAEMRALADAERTHELDVLHHGLALAHRRANGNARRSDLAARHAGQDADNAATLDALRAAGDVRALRLRESQIRAAKRRRLSR